MESRPLKLLLFCLTGLLAFGCGAPQRRNPPPTMAAGLIGYVTETKLVPRLRSLGVANVKCFMVPIKNESAYGVPRGFTAMANDIFETNISEAGFQIAAKEAVEAVARKVGITNLHDLFDDEVQQRFKERIQQEGVSIVDYIFLARITGTSPSLQLQGKLVSAQAGADFGAQVPVTEEINWKRLYAENPAEKISREWQRTIVRDQL